MGDSTYFYFWTGPNGFTSTSEDISNLCYGEYILTLDDGISSVTDTFNIFQPQPFVSNLIIDSINCYNDFTQAVINVWGELNHTLIIGLPRETTILHH